MASMFTNAQKNGPKDKVWLYSLGRLENTEVQGG